jgi:hypothetical protein
LAVLAALLAALFGAAAGQWIGWRSAGALPADDEASAVARLALGDDAPVPRRRDDLFGYDVVINKLLVAVVGSDGYGPGHVRFTRPTDTGSAAFERQTKDVRVRLQTAGWGIDLAGGGPLLFVGDKAGLRAEYSIAEPGLVALTIVRAQPRWVLPLGAAGALAGGVLGWLLARSTSRRLPRLSARKRATIRWLVTAGVLGTAPALVITGIEQGIGYATLSRPQIPLWNAVMAFGVRPVTVLALACIVVAVALTAFAAPVVNQD